MDEVMKGVLIVLLVLVGALAGWSCGIDDQAKSVAKQCAAAGVFMVRDRVFTCAAKEGR